ncbi:hypothetical protein [Streptacidiphilus sp. EB103A]|uniref:hypothetical protein n=1 Tax=Streptacidiphilus sp. EB103A TaxID=3156275 RepID=UPI003510DB99
MSTTDEPAGGPPTSPEDWRELLRRQDPPEEFAELPRRQRRRARKYWRTARRDERAQRIRRQRSQTPTGLHIPLTALVLAAAIAAYTWASPHHSHPARAATAPTSTAAPLTAPTATAAATATASATPATVLTDRQVASAFMTAYCTRLPLQDGSHNAAVARAAPYASPALVANLDAYDDADFDVLVSRQATAARPTAVTVTEPTTAQRPAPDTAVRVYLQATATIAVTGTHDYTYQRSLTLEISRSDTGNPWTVTRVLGLGL